MRDAMEVKTFRIVIYFKHAIYGQEDIIHPHDGNYVQAKGIPVGSIRARTCTRFRLYIYTYIIIIYFYCGFDLAFQGPSLRILP